MAETRPALVEWFRLDQNVDGLVTISDIWLLAGKVFHAPGDEVLVVIIDRWPKVAAFLELSVDSFGGYISGVISSFAWLLALMVLLQILVSFSNRLDAYHAYSPPGTPVDGNKDWDDDEDWDEDADDR